MPALITHDTFGRVLYAQMGDEIGHADDLRQAFLLGNQGPDPLFSAQGALSMVRWRHLGTIVHEYKPIELLAQLELACESLPRKDQQLARAWAAGFLCHYALDSNAHPLIYRQEFDLCDAGVPGLTRDNASEVHGAIEADLDEAALYLTRNKTIADCKPWKELVDVSNQTLNAASHAVSNLVDAVYGTSIPRLMYLRCTVLFRQLQHLIYSPGGGKRKILSSIERSVRGKSLYNAMAWQNRAHSDSLFDNAAHEPWENPFTHEQETESFVDLFLRAQNEARELIEAFGDHALDAACAREITCGLNFNGEPTLPQPAKPA